MYDMPHGGDEVDMKQDKEDLFGFDAQSGAAQDSAAQAPAGETAQETAASAAQAPAGETAQEAAASAASAAEWQEEEARTDVTKCPACGANMVYSSERGMLYCEHCGTEKAIEADRSEEIAFEHLLANNHDWAQESYVFRCENCGARGVVPTGEITTTCPYCGTSNIVQDDELPTIRPNALVPFAVGKDQARTNVKKWARKRLFAPRKFRKGARPEDLNGVYNPAFTFDAHALGTYRAVLGKYYYTTRRVNGKTVSERHIRYFTVSGQYANNFDDVLVQASELITQKMLNKLQPFDTNDSREYKSEYLSGFIANQNSKNGLACWEEAKWTIHNRLKAMILRLYTYDVVRSFNMNVQCSNITYKYILLPVYVGHCGFRKKIYNFFVNGLNGKVAGKAPVSPLKVTILTAVCIGVVVGLYFLFRYLSG